jgi:hypothetical protein
VHGASIGFVEFAAENRKLLTFEKQSETSPGTWTVWSLQSFKPLLTISRPSILDIKMLPGMILVISRLDNAEHEGMQSLCLTDAGDVHVEAAAQPQQHQQHDTLLLELRSCETDALVQPALALSLVKGRKIAMLELIWPHLILKQEGGSLYTIDLVKLRGQQQQRQLTTQQRQRRQQQQQGWLPTQQQRQHSTAAAGAGAGQAAVVRSVPAAAHTTPDAVLPLYSRQLCISFEGRSLIVTDVPTGRQVSRFEHQVTAASSNSAAATVLAWC